MAFAGHSRRPLEAGSGSACSAAFGLVTAVLMTLLPVLTRTLISAFPTIGVSSIGDLDLDGILAVAWRGPIRRSHILRTRARREVTAAVFPEKNSRKIPRTATAATPLKRFEKLAEISSSAPLPV
jgi:hypothetical protein